MSLPLNFLFTATQNSNEEHLETKKKTNAIWVNIICRQLVLINCYVDIVISIISEY